MKIFILPASAPPIHEAPSSKRCKTCREDKLLGEFAPRSGSHDGVRNHCRECCSTGRRQIKTETAAQKAGRKERQSRQEWHRSHAEALKLHAKLFPKAARATSIATTAFHAGVLSKPTYCQAAGCQAESRLEKHHHDGDQLLSVLWVCPAHHRQGHSRGFIDVAPGIAPLFGRIPPRA